MNADMKVCIDCVRALPRASFRPRSARPWLVESVCIECHRKRNRERARDVSQRRGMSLSTHTKKVRPLRHATTLAHSAHTDLYKGRFTDALLRLKVTELLLNRILGIKK